MKQKSILFIKLIMCLAAFLGLSGQVSAGVLEDAQKGLPDAQYELGNEYYSGRDAEQDYEAAAYWYLKAAEQGHIGSQYQ